LLKKLFYNILILTIFLFIFLEFIYPKTFKYSTLLYRFWGDRTVTFYPNKKMRAATQNYDHYFVTNSLGYNDYEVKKKVDILILGDSFVQAIEVDQKDHFSETIKQKYKNITIAKIGMSGFGNSHYLANYEKFKKKFDPDIVIIVNVFNDIYNNFCDHNTSNCSSSDDLFNIKNNNDLNKEIKFLKTENDNFIFNYSAKNELSYLRAKFYKYNSIIDSYYSTRDIYSKFLKLKRKRENKIFEEEYKGHNITNNKFIFDYYKKINDLLHYVIVKKDNKKLLFITINRHLYEDPLNPSKNPNSDVNLKLISKSIEKKGYPHIDLDPIMRLKFKNSGLLPHWDLDSHWNELGHEIVGLEISNYIKKNGWFN
jgi:hypothetical protein